MSVLDHEALLKAQREQAIRDVIDSSRDDVPPPEGKERLFAKLALEPVSSPSHRPALWRVRQGASVYLVGLALVVGGSVAFLAGRAEEPRLASSPTSVDALTSPAAPVGAEAPAKPDVPVRAAPSAGEMPAAPEPRASEPSNVVPAARPAERPSSIPATSSTAGLATDAARAEAPARSASTLGREVARVTAARSALAAGDAPHTLELLDSYESEFPNGTFSVEVSVLRVEALARAGRTEEARRLGERFLREHPTGLFAKRVTSTLGAINTPEPASVP